jgi:hypothetical protein
MPARRLRLVAPLLALLVALGGLLGGGVLGAPTGDAAGVAGRTGVDVATRDDHGPVSDAAAVVGSVADHLRPVAAPSGPVLAWLGAAALAAAALAVGSIALLPAAVPSRTTAHVRRRGPPSPV